MVTAQVSPSIQPRTPQGVFANEPFTDFSNAENAHAMRRALDHVAAHLGSEYSLIVGGKRLKTPDKIRSDQSGAAGTGGRRASAGGRRAR